MASEDDHKRWLEMQAGLRNHVPTGEERLERAREMTNSIPQREALLKRMMRPVLKLIRGGKS